MRYTQPYKDIKGMVFGRLTVLRKVGVNKTGHITWLCKCTCGKEVIVDGNSLRRGKTQSCGCLRLERAQVATTKHGLCKTRLYKVWQAMKERCLNPKSSNYEYYGARGITICDEWESDFGNFHAWAISNGYNSTLPKGGCTLDRIDFTKGYTPENCRWVSVKVQNKNRNCNKFLTYKGRTLCIADWEKECGFTQGTIKTRLKYGWSIQKILETPPRGTMNMTYITYKGKTQCIHAWEKELGFTKHSLRRRLQHGWSIEKALGTPPRKVSS